MFGAVPMMRTRQYQKGFFNQPVTKNFRRKIFAINPGQVRPGFSMLSTTMPPVPFRLI